MRRMLYIFLFLLVPLTYLNAQVLNNKASIYAVEGTTLYINGSTHNSSSGQIQINASTGNNAEIITHHYINDGISSGDGVYHIKGDWSNNNIFNAGIGTVFMEGAVQQIGGIIPSYFYNLTLAGSNIKTQSNHQFVTSVLNINDIELATETYFMTVQNSDLNAVQRTSGFISSLDTGALVRKTTLQNIYTFPVGSSIGTLRYRPVEIEPLSTDTTFFSVRMANINASTEGFDRNLLHPDICNTNELFYHRINRTLGVADINLSIFFDPTTDGNWDAMAHWTTNPLWETVAGSTTNIGTPFNFALASNWSNFSATPYILYSKNFNINLGADTTICGITPFTIDAGQGADTYTWNNGDTTQTITVLTDGIYSVSVTKGNCTVYDSINVTFNIGSSINLGNDTSFCSGGALLIDAGSGYSSYSWNTSDTTQSIIAINTGTYIVNAIDSNGCVSSDTLVLSLNSSNASIDNITSPCYDDPPFLLTSVDTGGYWYGTGILSPNSGLFDPSLAGVGIHTITHIITEPCYDTATANINVLNCDPYEPHAVVPDIFSPNGDGENDVLYVRGEGIETLYFAVFSRWGENVFQTSNKNTGWNGTYKDKPLDPGVFVYHLRVTLINKTEINIRGDVTLIR